MSVILPSSLLPSIIVITFLYLIIKHLLKYYLSKEVSKLPGPIYLPFIGNIYYFLVNIAGKGILKNGQKLMKDYPSAFYMSHFSKQFCFIYDPEHLQIVLKSSKTLEKDELYKYAQPVIGNGLLTGPVDRWKNHRSIIMPTFNARILDNFSNVISKKSEILVQQMSVELNGKEFEISKYVSLCTLDVVCETFMGLTSNNQIEKSSVLVDNLDRICEIIHMRMCRFWLQSNIIFKKMKLSKEYNECINHIHSFTSNLIQRKKQQYQLNQNDLGSTETKIHSGNTRKAFLDLLIELNNEGIKVTDEELKEEVNTMILAGYDTTASTISFVMLMLASNPKIQEKVYEELCEIYENNTFMDTRIKLADLSRMKYLELVIKETLRLFPVAPIIARRTTDDFNLGKYKLSKGSSIIIGIWHTHRNEKYWKDPLQFNPDRFLPEECTKRHPYSFLPFSAGPRNCPGTRFSMMLMKTVLATVVRKYVLKKDTVLPIEDISLMNCILAKPFDPITLRIEERIHRS